MKVVDGLLAPEWRRKGDVWREGGREGEVEREEREEERRRRERREKWEEEIHGLRQEAARLAVREGQREREKKEEEAQQQQQQLTSSSTFLQEPPPSSLPPSLAVFQDPLRQMQLILGRPPSLDDLPWLDASGLLSPPPSLSPSPPPSSFVGRLLSPPPSLPPPLPPSLERWVDLWVCKYWIEAERTYEARRPPSVLRRREGGREGGPRGRAVSLQEWREEEERERRRRGEGVKGGWWWFWRRREGGREVLREEEGEKEGGAKWPSVLRDEGMVGEEKEEEQVREGGREGGREEGRKKCSRKTIKFLTFLSLSLFLWFSHFSYSTALPK